MGSGCIRLLFAKANTDLSPVQSGERTEMEAGNFEGTHLRSRSTAAASLLPSEFSKELMSGSRITPAVNTHGEEVRGVVSGDSQHASSAFEACCGAAFNLNADS